MIGSWIGGHLAFELIFGSSRFRVPVLVPEPLASVKACLAAAPLEPALTLAAASGCLVHMFETKEKCTQIAGMSIAGGIWDHTRSEMYY